jgi:SNF2 family DNA or RNA helicase
MGDVWSMEVSPSGTKEYVNNISGDRQCVAPQSFQGGLLADDMGLGKTLTMIALVASDRHRTQPPVCDGGTFEAIQYPSEPPCEQTLQPTTATLLVVPSSLLHQWEMQLDQHLHTDGPAAVQWRIHKGKSKLNPQDQIDNYSIIITSFQTLVSDYRNRKDVLFTTFWHRIVLDEAHCIRNRHTATTNAVFNLQGASRWAITGTPLQNRLSDFCTLLQFLRVYPYCNRKVFEEDIIDVWGLEDENLASERLKRLFKFISIRRSKAILNLPQRTDIIRRLHFDDIESAVYETLETPIANMIDDGLQNEDLNYRYYMQALVKINMLRKFCNLGLSYQVLCHSENTRHPGRHTWSMGDTQAILDDLLSSGQSACVVCKSNIFRAAELSQTGCNNPDSAFLTECSRLICLTCYSQRNVVGSPPPTICMGHPPCEIMSVSLTDPSLNKSLSTIRISTKLKELKKELLQHCDEKWSVFTSG